MRDAIRQVTGKAYRLGPYKKSDRPEENDKDKEDSLSQLLQKAEDMGISIDLN